MDAQTLQRALDLALTERKRLDDFIATLQAEITRQRSGTSGTATIPVKDPVIKLQVSSTKPPGRAPKYATCTVPGCTERHVARGLCNKHYSQRARQMRKKADSQTGPKDLS